MGDRSRQQSQSTAQCDAPSPQLQQLCSRISEAEGNFHLLDE